MKLFVLVGAVLAALTLAVSAGAETAVLQPAASLPWTDPNHQSPTEVLASSVATQIAGHPTRAYCNSASEWSALGFNPGSLGVVRIWVNGFGYIAAVEDAIHLAEPVCAYLQRYGEASHKPTRCDTTQSVTRTVYETQIKMKKVYYWKKIKLKNGHTKRVRKSKWVTVKVQVPRQVTVQVPGPSVPCYGSTQALPADYRNYVLARHVLAHESVHAFYAVVGTPAMSQFDAESLADCYGMQLAIPTAGSFGGDEDDARAMGKFYLDAVYPGFQGTPYWRPGCVANGPFDLSPNEGVWPYQLPWSGPLRGRTHEVHRRGPDRCPDLRDLVGRSTQARSRAVETSGPSRPFAFQRS